jgi:RNA-directed DNA polymerase
MKTWSPRTFQSKNNSKPQEVVRNALGSGKNIQTVANTLPVIFSLKHLSLHTGVTYETLRNLVNRKTQNPYRSFKMRKQSSNRYRIIRVPSPQLKTIQTFINSHILSKLQPHSASVAYAPGSKIYDAAQEHCAARWILKFDISDFFDSVNEKQVYHVFRKCGYPALLSFEMARLCTILKPRAPFHNCKTRPYDRYKIKEYVNIRLGTLPQGAPSSPMLANLVSMKMDEEITSLAEVYGCTYTRYADDMTFSTAEDLNRQSISQIINRMTHLLASFGYRLNQKKTKVISPGARKIYLGLNVNESKPHLTKAYKRRISKHLYFCLKSEVGPEAHSKHLRFYSIIGFKNHLYGLIAYAKQIEPDFGNSCMQDFNKINWPL